jgi:hypothetical protein
MKFIYQADGIAGRACQLQNFLRHASEGAWGTMIGRPRWLTACCPMKCVLEGQNEIELCFEPLEVSSCRRTVEEWLKAAPRTLAARSPTPLSALTASSAQLTDNFTCSSLMSRPSQGGSVRERLPAPARSGQALCKAIACRRGKSLKQTGNLLVFTTIRCAVESLYLMVHVVAGWETGSLRVCSHPAAHTFSEQP